MSIRYYLLLIAGITTTVVFLGSFFMESFLLNRSLQTAGKASQELYEQMFVKRKEYLEDFIQDSLARKLSQVNALLDAVSLYKPLAEWFSPTKEHREKGTWASGASLIQQDEWIQFLQNSTGSSLLSLIIPDRGPFLPVKIVPIEEGLSWVYVADEKNPSYPYVGIRLHNTLLTDPSDRGEMGTLGVLPCVYVLYDIDRLRHFPSPKNPEDTLSYVPIPFAQSVEIDEVRFLADMDRARKWVNSPGFTLPIVDSVIASSTEVEAKKNFREQVGEFLQERSAYASELFLLWEAAVLQQIGVLGIEEPFWPNAMTFSAEETAEGKVFFLRSVMDFSAKLFDDNAFYLNNPPKNESSFVSSGSFVVKGLKENQVFLGNTAALFAEQEEGKSRQSLLSIGVDLRELLCDLVTSTHCYGIIVSGGQALALEVPQGRPPLTALGLEKVLENSSPKNAGVLSIGEEEYHFFHIQPDAEMDLHFFLLNPKQDAFDFSYNFQVFQSTMEELLEKLDVDRRLLEGFGVIILWLLLLRLSKKITKPIMALSSSLTHVKKGEWDKIQFPKSQFQRKNEIKMLCDSFKDMVEGMKEKEKVEGILNKVVSPEIAKEILKGEVSLGGEEKIVTMLFVDIRGFTQLTQTMDPREVISLLNTCMTKLSSIIEAHKGVIDKYLGDGLMALYGAPISYEESTLYAIKSGMQMLKAMDLWNEERTKKGLPIINIGVGIHTGSVCAGNMGAQNRLNYTVIGSAVNMASRLCGVAEAGSLLITEETYKQRMVQEHVRIEEKGLLSLKGFDEKKEVYRVVEWLE